MHDKELARQLLDIVQPEGDSIQNAIKAGEDVAAIIDLTELAATRRITVPKDLLYAVSQLASEGRPPMDAVDTAALLEDIDTLSRIAKTA